MNLRLGILVMLLFSVCLISPQEASAGRRGRYVSGSRQQVYRGRNYYGGNYGNFNFSTYGRNGGVNFSGGPGGGWINFSGNGFNIGFGF